jgi:hypothetical protein
MNCFIKINAQIYSKSSFRAFRFKQPLKACNVLQNIWLDNIGDYFCSFCPHHRPRFLCKPKLEWRTSSCVDLLWLVNLGGCQYSLFSKLLLHLHWLQSTEWGHSAEWKCPETNDTIRVDTCKKFTVGVLGTISDFVLTFCNKECNSSLAHLHIYLQRKTMHIKHSV